ncbi:acetyl-CoA carboxylase, carboxyltransferase subunit beta [Acanthopleuribacter pedis]|uniref:Acetyl-coenzyme A carboxylase carboxyl transferase subunit beta n=1 Tax=Acanthopleuribacter pedis TaxID=442870 RepID=A0A8J7QBH4_9BACT|nr:acetyl-CoA carboxylase, carboxyltransferase subunit beta [Acanthopleuribacter pedis]MBO1317876.1 acetyl-CoA carboxylase carboxyltransferase subunit beta [Acanthopleuribacter pedis]
MSWFIKKSSPIKPAKEKKSAIPEGLWDKCLGCKEIIYRQELKRNNNVCPKCDYHFRVSPEERLALLFDEGAFELLFDDVQPLDPLSFKAAKAYKDQLKKQADLKKVQEAVWVAKGKLGKSSAVISVMDFSFLGGSMGSVVGEKLTRGIELATEEGLAVIIFSCSGGARMMEGAISLMQMAKISAALARLAEKQLPFISVLTDPTTGGVTASYAMLGDINIAEPKALIGFAGPRVIQQTIRQELPPGFQRSEFLLEHGMLDAIVTRGEMRDKLIKYLTFFSGTSKN